MTPRRLLAKLLPLAMTVPTVWALGCADPPPVQSGDGNNAGNNASNSASNSSPGNNSPDNNSASNSVGNNSASNSVGNNSVGNNGTGNNSPGNNSPSNNSPDNNGTARTPHCSPAEREVCEDGIDNNCDGLVDEGCTCVVAQKECYSGHPDDLIVPGTSCRAGTQSCTGEFYSSCTGEVLPDEEVCDGVDNDCDGLIDEVEGCSNTPPIAICPPDLTGPTLAFYTFSGGYEDPDGDPMASARWRILERPTGSTASPNPSSGLEAEIFADVQGTYLMELEVRDTNGGVGRCTTTLETNSQDQLRVELLWNIGASGDGSDLDLHMLKSPAGDWFNDGARGDDCFWRNCRVCNASYNNDYEDACRAEIDAYNRDPNNAPPAIVEWSAPLNEDDPRLDLDDIEGNGPENLNIRTPLNGIYRVGVHYWDDDGFGDSVATVRIYCGGSLIKEFEPVLLRAVAGSEGNNNTEFWEVGDIIWRDGTCTLQEFGAPGCREICTRIEAENGGCPDGASRGLPCR